MLHYEIIFCIEWSITLGNRSQPLRVLAVGLKMMKYERWFLDEAGIKLKKNSSYKTNSMAWNRTNYFIFYVILYSYIKLFIVITKLASANCSIHIKLKYIKCIGIVTVIYKIRFS